MSKIKILFKGWLKKNNLFIPLVILIEGVRNRIKHLHHRIIYSYFIGKGLTCNFCGAMYTKFVPFDAPVECMNTFNVNRVVSGFGPNNLCPKCYCSSRERLVKIAIEKYFVGEKKYYLVLGPGKNEFNLLKKYGRVKSIDFQPDYYRQIDPTIEFGDATNLAYGDEEFDYVVANHILEHIPDDLAAMRELYRVLKKGGKALLQVPYSEHLDTTIEQPLITNPKLQLELYGQSDHVRIYSLNDYIKRLECVGFSMQVIRQCDLGGGENFGLQNNEVIFLGSK